MSLDYEYNQRAMAISDIQHHFPTLRQLASGRQHVTEFGVRGGNSTIALLSGRPDKMISYDVNPMPEGIKRLTKEEGLDFTFYQKNVLEVEIEPTELLFIDTLHNADQLEQELALHAKKVSHLIAFHDTELFGFRGETDGDGLIKPIGKFLNEHKYRWGVVGHSKKSNGLTVLGNVKLYPQALSGFRGFSIMRGDFASGEEQILHEWGLFV